MSLTSLRSRLLAVVTLLLAVSFLATNLIHYQVMRASLKQAAVERELPLTGDTIYSAIQADLVRPIFVASLMASDTFLRDWALEGEKDPERVRRYLDEIRDKYGLFTAFFVSERTRRYYHFSGVSKTVSEKEPRDAWYFRVREMAPDYEINVDPNQQQDDRVTIFINHRVADYDGRFIGVTGVGLALDTVAGIMELYRDNFRRKVYFAERGGRITLHPDPDTAYRLSLAEVPGMAPIADAVLASDRGAFEYEGADGTVLLTTRFIPELNWILLVEEQESVAIAGAANGRLQTLLIGLAAIVITSLAIGWTINRFQRRLEEMATTDPLTGLYNRQVFDLSLQQAAARARRNGTELSLVILDLDRFKTVNDRFGHLKGDAVLKEVAAMLTESIRKSDTLARWGGEEFAVLMENCSHENALRATEILRQRIAEAPLLDHGADPRVTGSFGVATLHGDEPTRDLMTRADLALYRAKDRGRNRVEGNDTADATP